MISLTYSLLYPLYLLPSIFVFPLYDKSCYSYYSRSYKFLGFQLNFECILHSAGYCIEWLLIKLLQAFEIIFNTIVFLIFFQNNVKMVGFNFEALRLFFFLLFQVRGHLVVFWEVWFQNWYPEVWQCEPPRLSLMFRIKLLSTVIVMKV